jgi:hypothetical protein
MNSRRLMGRPLLRNALYHTVERKLCCAGQQIETQQANALQLRPNGMSIDLLRAVYRSTSIPLPIRLRAAIAALPHEVPRLAVTALVNEQSAGLSVSTATCKAPWPAGHANKLVGSLLHPLAHSVPVYGQLRSIDQLPSLLDILSLCKRSWASGEVVFGSL